MKHIFGILSAAALAACACMVSCNKIDETPEAEGWTVSISASGESPSKALSVEGDDNKLVFTFQTTDNIYVYNKTKGKADPSPLHPDQNGAKANLVGTLSESYSAGDELVLCYNPEYIEGDGLRFSYGNQTGDLSTVADFAKAVKTISAEEASAQNLSGSVTFENLQSIFYLAFPSTLNIKRIIIATEKNKLVHTDMTYHKFGGVTTSKIVVNRATPSNKPFYVALRNENTDADTYLFLAEDVDGYVYKGDKAAQAGKIVNGKFYTSEIAMHEQSKFTVKENGSSLVPPNEGSYGYKDYADPYVTGTGIGQYIGFYDKKLQSLTLDNVHLISHDHTPIVSDNSTLFPLIIIGDNTIETDSRHPGIAFCSYYTLGNPHTMPLFIKGNGNLTITSSNSIGHSGILDTYGVYTFQAVDGYTVTFEDIGDNGNGTYTWLYKVRANN